MGLELPVPGGKEGDRGLCRGDLEVISLRPLDYWREGCVQEVSEVGGIEGLVREGFSYCNIICVGGVDVRGRGAVAGEKL